MNNKLFSIIFTIFLSLLIVYLFFIIMKPNTNKKVIPTYMKNKKHIPENDDDIDNENDDSIDIDSIDNDNNSNYLYNNIVPLTNDESIFLPANELNQINYKNIDECQDKKQKDFFTKDAPLFSEQNKTKIKPINMNEEHRRVNFY